MSAFIQSDLRKKLAKTARATMLAGAVSFAVGTVAGCSSLSGGPFSCKGMSSCKGQVVKNGSSGKNGCRSR